MVEESENRESPSVDKTGEFFNVGAPLHAVRPGYIRRPADDNLYNAVVAGSFAHVIAPDRSGKTSLVAATSARLQNHGFKVATLDLAQIGERDGGTDAGRWYYSIAYRLSRQLRLKTDLQAWWHDHTILSNRQRLFEFYAQLVLQNIQERVVVFVDEIQVIEDLPFDEHLLASIRAAHNARTSEPDFNRLSFVLIGECDPYSLVDDPNASPFSVSTEIRLNDFSRDDLNIFAAELNLTTIDADRALDRLYYWTSGQPYLSQKLARAISREGCDDDVEDLVDRLAMQQLSGRAAITSEPHMSHVHRAVMSDRKNYEAMLTTYGKISKGMKVEYDPDSARHRRLLAIGLVVVHDDGTLRVRNRLYASVFTASWANEYLPMHWRGPAVAAALVIALTAIPFVYTQLLPKPYLRIMSTASLDLESVTDAYQNLRSFPGHQDAADRMFQNVLENRARQAADRRELREISRYAAILPNGSDLVESMRADFWDRRTVEAMQNEKRDDALLAAIESLSESSQVRRRRAASLVGDDFPHLIATVPVQEAATVTFNADSGMLSYFNGASVSQWSAAGGAVEIREPWSISALEVTPLVRRVIVDREGTAGRIGLTVNVSHPRLDDLRMRLIAPSGRAAELTFNQPSSAANEEIRVPADQLEPLMGETLSGTWSLTLRDEATDVTGHLMNWNLSLNSQVVVETFERGLDIPDPVERESGNLWISPDGRYAIARALQSDSARVWDLNFAQAARTIAVPANQRVLGLSAGAEFLVTMTQSTVNLWRTSDGRRADALELGAAVADTMLSADGLHLVAVYQSDPDTDFEIWSLRDRQVVAELSVAGDPALMAVDAAANHIAIADYDRAVRVWDLREGIQRAQIHLEFQPSRIELSADGQALGVVLAGQGVALWRTDQPDAPIFEDAGPGEWNMSFSPSGARFVAGNHEEGIQTYRTADGLPAGPLLDPGLTGGANRIYKFSADENLLVTAGTGDIARFWSLPAGTASAGQEPGAARPDVWRRSGVARSAIAPGGERIAFGDRSGHVHIDMVHAASAGAAPDSEEISFLGHQAAVTSLVFSRDGAFVASAAADGTIRIWDAASGLPRSFYGRSSVSNVIGMVFSPTARRLAVLGPQRLWLMDTETGADVATVDLGEIHHDLAFVTDDRLYVGAASGTLRNVYADRTGNWHLRNDWRGERAIRHIEVGDRQILLVDADNQVHLLDPASGQVSFGVFSLPSTVRDVAFSPNQARVLFRTGRWIHRALITATGLVWTDSVRSPKPTRGSGMAFETARSDDGRTPNLSGDRVLILARDSGVTELAELRFSFSDGPALFGSRGELLDAWTERLRGPQPSDSVREGF